MTLENDTIKSGKGETLCNRTACQRPLEIGEKFWNPSTQAYYCRFCASRINQGAGFQLCVCEGTEPEKETP